MIGDWIAQAPAVLAALALIVLPGAPTALFSRASGIVRLGIAVGVSFAIIAAATLIAPVLGLGWSLVPVVVVALVVSAVAGALRWRGRSADAAPAPPTPRLVWATLAVAFLGWAVLLVLGIRTPDHPNQLYDVVFHLNAVEFITQHGDASPLHMTMVVPGSGTMFYPTLWHATVSLIVPVAGSVVAATNVVSLVVVALVWPLAITALTAVLLPKHPGALVWAPLAGFGLSVFPFGALTWGVLYPHLLGMALAPLLIMSVLRAVAADARGADQLLRMLIALALVGATALAHPSAVFAAFTVLVPFALSEAWTLWRGQASVRGRVGVAAATVLGLAALVVVWGMANVTTHEWLPSVTMAQAFGEVAFLSPVGRTAGLLLGPLAAIGIWRLVRERTWWILGAYAVAVGLYVAATWFPVLALRSFFVGIWYDDTTRVGALLALIGLPLVALGASVVASWIARWWREGHRARATLVGALIVAAASTHLVMITHDLSHMRGVSFRFDEQSQGVSPAETDVFAWAAEHLDEDSLVIADPLTGAGLVYAYAGIPVVFPHITGTYGSDADLIARELRLGGQEVCAAIERLGVTHALDFGDVEIFPNEWTHYDGLHDLERSPVLEERARTDDAVLYEITGCR